MRGVWPRIVWYASWFGQNEAGGLQGFGVNVGVGLKALESGQVHNLVLGVAERNETALLRKALGERVLATFEAGADTAAGAGVLALGTAAGRLAVA